LGVVAADRRRVLAQLQRRAGEDDGQAAVAAGQSVGVPVGDVDAGLDLLCNPLLALLG
jgi:hypothetical protein